MATTTSQLLFIQEEKAVKVSKYFSLAVILSYIHSVLCIWWQTSVIHALSTWNCSKVKKIMKLLRPKTKSRVKKEKVCVCQTEGVSGY